MRASEAASDAALDSGSLDPALRDLAFAVQALQLYPASSPVVSKAVARAHQAIGPLLRDGPLSLAVLPDSLQLGSADSEEAGVRSRNVRGLAERLHQRGVAHVRLDGSIKTEALQRLAELLATDVDVLREQGGINAGAEKRAMSGIDFEMLQLDKLYDSNSGEPADPDADVWSRILGAYGEAAASGGVDWQALAADPASLAGFLDWILDEGTATEGLSEMSRVQLVRSVCERSGEAAATLGPEHVEAVAGVFGDLYDRFDRELWIDLIGQPLEVGDGRGTAHADLTRNIGATLDRPQVEDLLGYALTSRDTASPRILGLFQRLLEQRDDRDDVQQTIRETIDRQASENETGRNFDDLWPQLHDVIHGENPDDYVSATYRASLDRLLLDGLTTTVWDLEGMQTRLRELEPAYLVHRKAKIMLAVFGSATEDGEYHELALELERAMPELVVDGQYITTEEILRMFAKDLVPTSGRSDRQREVAREILVRFCNQHTLRQVVRNLAGRERTQIDAATRIFGTLGPMAVPALLEALSEETSRSLRAHLVGMLSSVGDQALPEIRKHLRDKRWFFVRNLVWIIGEVGAEGFVPHLGVMINHEDLRVRREAVRAIAKLRSPAAAEVLLGAINDEDVAVRLLAIRGLGLGGETQGADRLATLLGLPNLTGRNTEIIRAAAVSLGRMRAVQALPGLERVARAPWLCRGRRIHATEAAVWAIAAIHGQATTAAPEAEPPAAEREDTHPGSLPADPEPASSDSATG